MINAIIANIRKGYVARCLIALVCFTSLAANAAVYYVTPDGTGGGTSWSDATTLSDANGKVAAGDTIRMKAGTYTMTARVQVSKAITIEGGYKGEESSFIVETSKILPTSLITCFESKLENVIISQTLSLPYFSFT